MPALLSPLSSDNVTLAGELENINKVLQGPTVLTTRHLVSLFRPILTAVNVESIATIGSTDICGVGPVEHDDKLATILFTSGSTGYAKGVEYTHAQLIGSSRQKCDFHHMDSSKTFMCWTSECS